MQDTCFKSALEVLKLICYSNIKDRLHSLTTFPFRFLRFVVSTGNERRKRGVISSRIPSNTQGSCWRIGGVGSWRQQRRSWKGIPVSRSVMLVDWLLWVPRVCLEYEGTGLTS